MITQLIISQFAIVEHLSIDFSMGMTAITGETGAGKSIAIDALSVCLGARADASMVRHGASRADITAHFVIENATCLQQWLEYHQLDEGNDCILRRVINQDGRSKAFINGRVVPVSQLKALGQQLIQIHGQHEHQLLLKTDHQHALLNQYLSEPTLLDAMKRTYTQWKMAAQSWKTYEKQRDENDAHVKLLQYQLQELDEFAPVLGEFEKMEDEYKRLANSEQLIQQAQHTVTLLSESEEYNVLHLLSRAKQGIQDLVDLDGQLVSMVALLEEASIHIEEACYELRHYVDNMECDPERAAWLEARITKQIALARKHQVAPEALPECYQNKINEYAEYEQRNENGVDLKQQMEMYYQTMLVTAQKLHEKRCSVSKALAKRITQSMQELSMLKGRFDIKVKYNPEMLQDDGADTVTFWVSTNEGEPLQPIAKVVSGGELSRLALAIQVLTAQKTEMPILVFDEIDVGISGSTAAKVGHLLRELGSSTQVITVTHLPQVAGNAHAHLFVDKQNHQKKTKTIIKVLDTQGRISELARLLAGDKITVNTLANAKELLVEDVF